MKSFVFIDDNIAYTQSTAAIKVCKYLGGLWPLTKIFLVVPKFIRDGLYNWIAKNRYKWFGKKESCMIPTPDVRQRFLQ
jgi:predicted DCC family thiol-disulfide oxidoreductase YuxK